MSDKTSSLSSKFIFFSIFSLFLVGFTVTESFGASYLKIEGIKGESTDDGHKDWINLLSVDFETSRESKIIDISKQLDVSSAKISEASIAGKTFSSAVLHVCPDNKKENCDEYSIRNLAFVKYSISVKENEYPMEEISFVYSDFSKSTGVEIKLQETSNPPEIPEDSSPNVPSWVKTTASFWMDGDVSDREFTDGIGYLIKEGIIDLEEKVESLTEDTPAEPEVPGWIKDSTRWWIEGQVPEDQFLESIKWLIKNGIIRGVPTQ